MQGLDIRLSKIRAIRKLTTNQNLIVKGKNYNSFDGLLGGKVSSNINVNEEVVLTPELYAMVDYAFKNKVPAIDARLQGMTAPLPTALSKAKQALMSASVLLLSTK
ncbi:Outer membrane protein rOmpA [Rickettsia felis URRWXCal2]|uniref:Outer membrane protein rOmpA n=2 Tax=Rickettsia felis TaxID=42862 RepID=Q4UJY7_RICFE|nr:Outer membrane protein rOmpA [Rickettsia felis URRWXCal2]